MADAESITEKKLGGRLWYLARADLSKSGSTESVHPRADVRELQKLGWNCTLFSSYFADANHQPEIEVFLTTKRRLFERFRFELIFCWMLLVSRERPDVLFVRAPSNLLLAVVVARVLGVKIVLELNGLFEYVFQGISWNNFPVAIIDRTMMRMAHMIVSVTPELKQYATGICGKRTIHVVAPNGVDAEFDSHPPSSVQEPSQSGSFNLGFIGRMYECRGLPLLVKVVAELNRQGIATTLKIAGSGPLQEELSRLADALGVRSKIEFAGVVPHADLPRLFESTNLMWSIFEDYPRFDHSGMTPLKVWTYLAMGKPVLARSGSYLKNYEFIPGMYWTESTDLPDVVRAILEFRALDRCRVVESVEKGQAHVKENATWGHHAKLIDKGLRTITKRSTSPIGSIHVE